MDFVTIPKDRDITNILIDDDFVMEGTHITIGDIVFTFYENFIQIRTLSNVDIETMNTEELYKFIEQNVGINNINNINSVSR